MLGREDEMVSRIRKKGERHIESRGRIRTLARSRVLLSMIMVNMLHSVHSERKGVGINKHHQESCMWLYIGFERNSYWSLPFLEKFPVVEHGLWTVEP
jgi:hypothetical protein